MSTSARRTDTEAEREVREVIEKVWVYLRRAEREVREQVWVYLRRVEAEAETEREVRERLVGWREQLGVTHTCGWT